MSDTLHSDSIELTRNFNTPALTVINGMADVFALNARGWKINVESPVHLNKKSPAFFEHTINFSAAPLESGQVPNQIASLRHVKFPGRVINNLRGSEDPKTCPENEMRARFLKDLAEIQISSRKATNLSPS